MSLLNYKTKYVIIINVIILIMKNLKKRRKNMDVKLEKNERIDDLEYKGYKIIQNVEGFCYGVDSVLLSDYAREIKKNTKVVDIGSGTGIISILLCAKTELKKIYGIEIQEDVAEMSRRSITLNDLNGRCEILNINIKDVEKYLDKNSFDAVVTNPPYKKENTGLKNIDKKNLISRHEVECNLEDIIEKSKYLLKDLGELFMVHRAERIVDIMCLLRKYNLEPKNIRFVHPKVNEKPNLVLVRAVKYAKPYLKIDNPLYIYGEDGDYTDEIYKIYEKRKK